MLYIFLQGMVGSQTSTQMDLVVAAVVVPWIAVTRLECHNRTSGWRPWDADGFVFCVCPTQKKISPASSGFQRLTVVKSNSRPKIFANSFTIKVCCFSINSHFSEVLLVTNLDQCMEAWNALARIWTARCVSIYRLTCFHSQNGHL